MSDETPVVTEVTPTVSPESTAPATPSVDYAAEFTKKANEVEAQAKVITDLRAQINTIEGTSEEARAERARLTIQAAELTTKQEGLLKELDDARRLRDEAVEKISRATEAAEKRNSDLEARLAEAEKRLSEYDEKIKQQELIALRDRIVNAEFAHLRRFASYLPLGTTEAEIRANLTKFDQDAYSPTMADAKLVLSGGVHAAVSHETVVRAETPLDDPDALRAALDKAQKEGKFEEVKALVIAAHEATLQSR